MVIIALHKHSAAFQCVDLDNKTSATKKNKQFMFLQKDNVQQVYFSLWNSYSTHSRPSYFRTAD